MQTVGHCTGLKRAGSSPRICRRVGKRLRGVVLLSRERRTAPRGSGRWTQYRGGHSSYQLPWKRLMAHVRVRTWCVLRRLWMSGKAEGVFIARRSRVQQENNKNPAFGSLRTDRSCTKFTVPKMSTTKGVKFQDTGDDGTQNNLTNVKL